MSEKDHSRSEKCDETTYMLNMLDHPRRRVKRHVNLLREFVSPTTECMLVHTESELDFGPSIKEEKECRPMISDRLTNEEETDQPTDDRIWRTDARSSKTD